MGTVVTGREAGQTTAKDVVGTVIAYMLLLYVVSAGYMIVQVLACGQTSTCSTVTFGKGFLYVVTVVGGLVSALVVARLAVATPGGGISFASASTASSNMAAKSLAWIYVGSWLVIGFAALIAGVMLYPDANQTVADLGTAWLGITVAAGYAYFGIDPNAK